MLIKTLQQAKRLLKIKNPNSPLSPPRCYTWSGVEALLGYPHSALVIRPSMTSVGVLGRREGALADAQT